MSVGIEENNVKLLNQE